MNPNSPVDQQLISNDINNGRGRWRNRLSFLLAAISSTIGLSNVWKFPYLTLKHGGRTFIIVYALVMVIVGMPMLVLELALGQKMQKGSVGALRGINPRLAGVGWAASFAGFVTCII